MSNTLEFIYRWERELNILLYTKIITESEYTELYNIFNSGNIINTRLMYLYELILNNIELSYIKENPNNIQYIINPDENIQNLAVKNDKNSINYIKNPKFSTLIIANDLDIK